MLTGINRVLEQALKCDTDEELGMTCLAVAEKITGSKFGFMQRSARTACCTISPSAILAGTLYRDTR